LPRPGRSRGSRRTIAGRNLTRNAGDIPARIGHDLPPSRCLGPTATYGNRSAGSIAYVFDNTAAH
jgi:hypothetical protein